MASGIQKNKDKKTGNKEKLYFPSFFAEMNRETVYRIKIL